MYFLLGNSSSSTKKTNNVTKTPAPVRTGGGGAGYSYEVSTRNQYQLGSNPLPYIPRNTQSSSESNTVRNRNVTRTTSSPPPPPPSNNLNGKVKQKKYIAQLLFPSSYSKFRLLFTQVFSLLRVPRSRISSHLPWSMPP